MKRAALLVRACSLLILAMLIESTISEPASTGDPSASQSPTSSPQSKEKRSQEDIMFGNQQNKPASGMVDGIFQSSGGHSKNDSKAKTSPKHDAEKPQSLGSIDGSTRSDHRQMLSELPDRLEDYDYGQPDSSDPHSGAPPSGAADEDEVLEEGDERNSFFSPPEQQEIPSFDTQKMMMDSEQIDRNGLGDFPVTEEEYEEPPSNGLLYRRRKRGAFHRLRSPLEDLLSSSGGPFRKRRASSISMRLKRDAASNELLNWLALLHRNQASNSRRLNKEEVAFQEFQGLKAQPLELPGGSGYLYEPLEDEEDVDDDDGLAASVLTLPEEGPEGGALDWELPVRAPPRRRSSAFYPLDYRYVILPGARKRANLLSAPGGRFGAMREGNRWPSEPQSGRWGQFPLLGTPHYQSRLGLPVVVRRAPPQPQESEAERLYALASLLAAPGASTRDFQIDPDEVRERRRRSAKPSSVASRG